MKKFYLFFLCAFLLSLVSCNFEIEEIIRNNELVEITLDTSKLPPSYPLRTTKETFDSDITKIKILGHYSDGTVKEEPLDYAKIDGFTAEKIGVVTINVDYKGYPASFEIPIVDDYPVKIEITNYPKKILYWFEEFRNLTFDLDGLEANVVYLSNYSEPVDVSEIEIEGYVEVPNNDNTIKVKFNYKNTPGEFFLYYFKLENIRLLAINRSFNEDDLISNLKLSVYNKLKINNYSENEIVDLQGIKINIDCFERPTYVFIPIEHCHIVSRIVQNEVLRDSRVTSIINGNEIYIDFNKIENYITEARLDFNELKFIKINYLGNSINILDEDSGFKFKRVLNNGDEEDILFNDDGTIKQYDTNSLEKLEYSINNGDFHPINQAFQLTSEMRENGYNYIDFKYTFKNKKTGDADSCRFSQVFYVDEARVDYIEASVKEPDVPVNFGISHNELLAKLNINFKKTDGSDLNFSYDPSKMEIVYNKEPKDEDFSKTIEETSGEFSLKYTIDENNIVTTKNSITVNFYKKYILPPIEESWPELTHSYYKTSNDYPIIYIENNDFFSIRFFENQEKLETGKLEWLRSEEDDNGNPCDIFKLNITQGLSISADRDYKNYTQYKYSEYKLKFKSDSEKKQFHLYLLDKAEKETEYTKYFDKNWPGLYVQTYSFKNSNNDIKLFIQSGGEFKITTSYADTNKTSEETGKLKWLRNENENNIIYDIFEVNSENAIEKTQITTSDNQTSISEKTAIPIYKGYLLKVKKVSNNKYTVDKLISK